MVLKQLKIQNNQEHVGGMSGVQEMGSDAKERFDTRFIFKGYPRAVCPSLPT